MKNTCPICTQLTACAKQEFPNLIHEFKYSYFVLGNHQFYNGYSLLLAKTHARELHHLDAATQQGLAQELMIAGRAVDVVFTPWKMNYASYGNQVEHVHWHIIPRYQNDPKHLECPFSNSAHFAERPTTAADIHDKLPKLKAQLV